MNKYLIIYCVITFLVVVWIQRSDKLNDKKKKNNIIKIFNLIKLPLLFTGILLLFFTLNCENKTDDIIGGNDTVDFLTDTPNF